MLSFAPSSFASPYTMMTVAEAADAVTVALNGPWVYQHQHPNAERRDEAQQAQEQALRDMYGFLRDGELTAYVEDPRTHRFLRVPREYFLEDAWGFGRCYGLSKLMNEGIPAQLEDQPILFLRADVDAWVATQNRRATARRGPKPKYDAEAFVAAAADELKRQGGYVVNEFDRPKLRAHMLQWCEDNWETEPSPSWVNDHLAKAEQRYDASN